MVQRVLGHPQIAEPQCLGALRHGVDRAHVDPVVALTYAAAVVRRIRLGASVVVLAIHSPL